MKGGAYMKRKLPEWCVEAKIAMLRQHNMSVTDLAKEIGVHRSYVSGVLNGRINAPEIAQKISKYLGMTISYN